MASRFESQSGRVVENPSPHALDQLVALIDGVDNTFASLTLTDGSYIQAGGGPDTFTVEIRQAEKAGDFRHFKAFLPDKSSDLRHLLIGGVEVTVRLNQILDLETVRKLFRTFLQSQKADHSVSWQDITYMFTAA